MDEKVRLMEKPPGLTHIQIWHVISACLSIGGTIVFDGLVLFAFVVGGPEVFFKENPNPSGIILLLICLLIPVFLIPTAIAFFGIHNRKQWSLNAIRIQAIFSLIVIPIGTIIGVLILRYIKQPIIREYLTSNCFFP